MTVGLGIAGILCIALALGHLTVGVIWILPHLTKERLPRTPFGGGTMTESMIRVTWYIVTVFVLALGGLLISLAWSDADPEVLLLRWFAAMWFVATAMATVVAARRVRSVRGVLRLPVPLIWIVVAVLCWQAST